ncbi:ORF120 [Angelfish iridovirus AFIV-16]|nr:ORF120 [Angelfish iridovirus AFIV-16]
MVDPIVMSSAIAMGLALMVVYYERSKRQVQQPERKGVTPDGMKLFKSGHVLHDHVSSETDARKMIKLITVASSNRLKQLGDPIRGDVIIKPRTEGLFLPRGRPEHSLQPGAVHLLTPRQPCNP